MGYIRPTPYNRSAADGLPGLCKNLPRDCSCTAGKPGFAVHSKPVQRKSISLADRFESTAEPCFCTF